MLSVNKLIKTTI